MSKERRRASARHAPQLAAPSDLDDTGFGADWVELAIQVGKRPLSRESVMARVEDAPSPSLEAATSLVWRELRRRAELYSDPPLEVSDDIVRPRSTSVNIEAYTACLLWSMTGNALRSSESGSLFETLACLALGAYLKSHCRVIGWPTSVDLRKQISSISIDMSEGTGRRLPPKRLKDAKLDGIAWIPFGERDRRSGKLVLLMQCAAGRNWKDKCPVPVENWCDYITFACRPPVKVFAVPVVVAEDRWFDDSLEKGLLLDRVRITGLLPRTLDRKLAQALRVLVADKLAEFQG
jgi:hypothetical protein